MVWLLLWGRLLPDPLHLLGQQQEELPALYLAGEDVKPSVLIIIIGLFTKILCWLTKTFILHVPALGFSVYYMIKCNFTTYYFRDAMQHRMNWQPQHFRL